MSDYDTPFDQPLSEERLPDFVQDDFSPATDAEREPPSSEGPAVHPDPAVPSGDVGDQPGHLGDPDGAGSARGEERPRDPATGRFLPKEAVQEEEVAQPLAEQAPAEETAQEKAERLWAGKYTDTDQLEKGYRELRDLQRRTAERAKAYEQRVEEVTFQARQLEDALRRAIPFVQQAQQGQPQQAPQEPQVIGYDQFGNPVMGQPQPQQPTLTPQQVQALTEQAVNERLAAQAQAQQQEMWKRQQYQEAASALDGFFQNHPEVERDGAADEDIADTILVLNEAWSSIDGGTLDISSPDALEIAYEASQRPALRRVLEMNPLYAESDEGMALARDMAGRIDGKTQAPAPAGRMTARPNTPVVERGSSPAPSQTPLDEFESAVADWRNERKAKGSDVFFGGE